jgi:hypothetical protein
MRTRVRWLLPLCFVGCYETVEFDSRQAPDAATPAPPSRDATVAPEPDAAPARECPTCDEAPFDPAEPRGCSANRHCSLVVVECCSARCGEARLEQFDAFNIYNDVEQLAALCGGERCTDAGCPDAERARFLRTSAHFASVCESGACTAVDLRGTAAIECAASSDCAVRYGTDCCQQGATTDEFIAFNAASEWFATLCNGVSCGDTPPPIPEGVGAACEAGRCVLVER